MIPKGENCLLRIKNALFLKDTVNRKSPSSVFKNPIKSFEVFSPGSGSSFWGITGTHKFSFLNAVAAKYIPEPPLSRKYPLFADNFRYDQIQYLNFRESSGLDKVHMSARYESFSYKGDLEMTDDVNSVKNYVTGANNYNSNTSESITDEFVQQLLQLFDLKHLESKWINSLSNGQMRRARIAKSLINKPSLLVIDDPFLGLDPSATKAVSNSLKLIADRLGMSIVLGLRIQDEFPNWIEHIGYVDELGLTISGPKEEVLPSIVSKHSGTLQTHKQHELKHRHTKEVPLARAVCSNPLIEFKNASVIYKDSPVLKEFYWCVEPGSRWRILGNNGSGKTTLLSLITADHPQSWRSVITINGVLRKTGSGVSYFDINNSIGISSPELHAIVPTIMTMKQIILNGLVPDVGNSNFQFSFKETELPNHAQLVMDEFKEAITQHGNKKFFELTVSQQKLALFLRAVIKNPEILILDEAFSCMDDEALMIKCHDFIEESLQDTTILAIGHIDWEVPKCEYVLKLRGDPERRYDIGRYI